MARERKFSTSELYEATKELLLEHGYEGFTFSLLATRLSISRSALYKYFDNKEELISEFMVHEMNIFIIHLQKIDEYKSFHKQFDYLLHIIFNDRDIHRLRSIGIELPNSTNKKVQTNQKTLEKLHYDMYINLQNFVTLGKKEGILKKHIPNGLFLGMIFQSIDIPNHEQIAYSEWISSIKEIISHGMYMK